MSSTDRRIVELEFDNKSFERGVKDTLKTLDGLDKSLDQLDGKSLKGLQDSIGNISFKGMEDGISSLNQKFSAMGDFARRIFENIADDVYQLGKKIISSTFGQIMSGGSKRALNIEQAKFMFQGLGLDIEEAMKNANDAVLDTAYGLDEAAVVASQLAASGVELGDDMTNALTAISGAAAMTGSEYIDIGRIFTTVAGNGRLMGDQLLQFSVRGLNLAADIGEAYGMTEAEVRDLVSKGAISFEMFYNTLYNKYAEQAKRANETFNGALSNVKAALSRIGAEIMAPYYTYARDVLNAVRPVLNSFKAEMAPVFEFIESRMRFASKAIIDFLNIYDGVDEEGKLILTKEAAYTLEKIAEILENSLGVVWNWIRIIVQGMGSIAKAFTNVFGKDILDTLAKVSNILRIFFARIADNEKLFKSVTNILSTVFNILKFGFNILKNIYSFLKPIFTSILAPIFNFLMGTGLAVIEDITSRLSDLSDKIANFKQIKIFGKSVEDIFETIKNAINGFTDVAVEKIHWFFDNLNIIPGLFVQLWDIIKNFASDTFGKTVSSFGGFGDALKKIKDTLADSKIVNGLKNIFDRIKDFVKNITITDVLYAIAGAFIYLKDTLKDVYDFLSPIFLGFFDLIKELAKIVKDTIIGSLSDEAGGNLLSGGILATIIILIGKVKELFKGLSLESLRTSVVGILDELRGVISSYQKSIDVENLWTLAKAIALMAGSITILSMLDTRKVVQVTGVIMGLGAGLAFFLKHISLTQKATTIGDALKSFGQSIGVGINTFLSNVGGAISQAIKLDSVMLAMDMFAFALVEMAGALKVLSTIDWNKMIPALTGMAYCFGLLAAAFVGLTWLSNNMTPKQVGSLLVTVGAFSLMATSLSASMLLFAGAISIFAIAYDKHQEGFDRGLEAMVIITATITIAMKAIAKTFKADLAARMVVAAASFVILASSITIIAVGLAALAGAFTLLDLVDWPAIGKGAIVLVGTVALLTGSAVAMKGAYADVLAMSVAIGIIAAAMYPLVGALALLELISWDSIEKFGGILAAFTAAIVLSAVGLAAAAALMAKAGGSFQSFSKSVLYFGAGVGAFGVGVFKLAEAIGILALAGPKIKDAAGLAAEGLVAFVVALDNASVQMDAAIQNLIGKLFENILNGIKNTLGPMIETLGEIIIGGLDGLREYLPPIIDKLADLIVEVLHQLTGKIPDVVDAVFEFLDALVGAIGSHLGKINMLDLLNLTGFTIGLTFIIKWFAKMKGQVKDALPMVGIIGLLLAELVGTFAIMDALDTDGVMKNAASIALVVATIGGVLTLMSGVAAVSIGGAIKAAIAIGAAFDIIVVMVGGIVAGLGWLASQWEGMYDAMEKGVAIVELVGSAIGRFIGAIVEGISAGVAAGLASIGQGLSDFWTNASTFFNGIQSLDDGVIDSAKKLAQTLLIMGGAEIVNAIANFLGGETNFEDLGNKLSSFANTIVDFASGVSKLEKEDLEKVSLAAEAAKDLGEFAKYVPKEGGLWQKIVGVADLDGFSDSIVHFGESLILFAQAVAPLPDYGTEAMDMAVDAGTKLSDFNNTIPTDGGGWQILAGSKNLSDWSDTIIDFSDALLTFAENAAKITEDDVAAMDVALQAGHKINDLNQVIPTGGGVWQLLAGGKDLGQWGHMIWRYGSFMTDFFADLDLPYNAVDLATRAADAGVQLARVSNSIPVVGGFWSVIKGGKDIGVFGEQVSKYGQALYDFYEKMKNVPAAVIDKASLAADATVELVRLNDAIPENDGNLFEKLGSLMGLDADSAAFTTMLSNLGSGLYSFSNKISGIDFEQVKTARLELSNLIGSMSRVDETVTNAGTNFKTSLENMASTSIQGFIDTFSGSYQLVVQAFNLFFTNISTGIKSYESYIEINGQGLGQALANGIASKTSTVGDAIITIIKGIIIYLALCEPAFQAEGKNAIQGYANGIKSGVASVSAAMALVSSAAKGAMNISGNMYWVGRDAIQGFINGGKAMQESVYWAYWDIGKLALEAAKKALDSNSPSKEFFKLGADSDRGLANGLIDYAYLVENSSKRVANVALDSVGNSISKLSAMLENDIDITPTITPVMDLSQIQNGIYGANNLLSGINPGYMGAVGRDISSMYAINNSTYNDTNVVKSINELTTRIDTLGNDMRNLKVVLNNGTLVGEIAPDMNNELGNMNILTRRGVL